MPSVHNYREWYYSARFAFVSTAGQIVLEVYSAPHRKRETGSRCRISAVWTRSAATIESFYHDNTMEPYR